MKREEIAEAVAGFYSEIVCPYTAEELVDVFCVFFSKYRMICRQDHPAVTASQLRDYAERLPFYSWPVMDPALTDGTAYEIQPDAYGSIIGEYLTSKYNRGKCNHHLPHFMTGNVRRNAAERAGVIRPGQHLIYRRAS